MIGFDFDKERAEELLKNFHEGKPFAPKGEFWTGNELLQLAGICTAAIWDTANADTTEDDILAAVDHVSSMITHSYLGDPGEYGELLAPHVTLVVTCVTPIESEVVIVNKADPTE